MPVSLKMPSWVQLDQGEVGKRWGLRLPGRRGWSEGLRSHSGQRCGPGSSAVGTAWEVLARSGGFRRKPSANGLEGPVRLMPAASLGFWSRGQEVMARGRGREFAQGRRAVSALWMRRHLPCLAFGHRTSLSGPGRSLETSVTAHWASRGQPAEAAHSGPSWLVSAQAGTPGRAALEQLQGRETCVAGQARHLSCPCGGEALRGPLPVLSRACAVPALQTATHRSARSPCSSEHLRDPGHLGLAPSGCSANGSGMNGWMWALPLVANGGSEQRAVESTVCGCETQTPTCSSCVCVCVGNRDRGTGPLLC